MVKPLLIVSDAVTSGTGLGRIARDLATRIATNMSDVYRVATAGYGGPTSQHLPFHQYVLEGVQDFVCPTLPQIWEDWAGEEKGIILWIWDLSRLTWFSDPVNFPIEGFGLQQWLMNPKFEKWVYAPIDASGPNDGLTFPLMKTLLGFDRVLAYGSFGEGVIRRTIGDEQSDKRHLTNLPHGINSDVFFELNRKQCRKLFFQHTGALPLIQMDIPPIADDEVLIGILGTNQPRKDWSLGIATCAVLAQNRKIRVWCHTDFLEKNWSIPALLADYGLIDKAVVSLGYLSDEHLAEGYSACDLVLGIAPEGFGYVHVEAQACGCPVVTGSYAGGAELVPKQMRVEPEAFRYEGEYASKRPVYEAWKWAAVADRWIGKRVTMDSKYDWSVLWPRWEAYLRKAAE